MPKGTSLLLIIWNVVLTGLLGWSLMRKPAATTAATTTGTGTETQETAVPAPLVRDTGLLKDARIAYYELDSVETGYKLIEESKNRVKGETKREQEKLEREMGKAQQRAQELMQKDHTYSTKAERDADQAELEALDQKLGQMRMDASDRIDQLQEDVTRKINDEIVATLEEYNKTAGFDYIISVQEAGQVWPGNKGLNVTNDIVQMLNARHQATKK
jgi:outer membrane protein